MANKQDKYTKSAKGQACQIRIPRHCVAAPENETTVPCHLNGGGMAVKHSSIHLAYGCNYCHDVVDGRVQTEFSDIEIQLWFLQAVIRTQIIMIGDNILKL